MKTALDLAFVAGLELAEGKARVGQARGLDQFGFAQAELVEARLEAAMVEQRELHRCIGPERLTQQFGHARLDALALDVVARPCELLVAQVLLRRLLRGADAAVRAEAGAADERATRQQREGCFHRPDPPGADAAAAGAAAASRA